jgi:superfamily II DNA/RNA helicase
MIKERINSNIRIKLKDYFNKNLNKCAIIYGNLPPEIKKDQAIAFNEGKNGVEYLVATDAVQNSIKKGGDGS